MKKRLLAGVLAALLCAAMATGCKPKDPDISGGAGGDSSSSEIDEYTPSGPGLDVENNDPYADFDVAGSVTVAINRARDTDYEALFDTFSNFYPNIKLTIERFETAGHAPEYLTAKAQSGTLPDVMFDDPSPLTYFISQGWMYPLNDFVEGDPDYEYVPESLRDSYTFGGDVYAIPGNVHFQCMILNTDIMDDLNLQMPSLDWDTDDFADLLRAATTDKYSGTEDVFNVDANLALTTSKDCTFLGYNYEDRSYHLRDAWAPCVAYEWSLREVPGLEAWSMRLNQADGEDITDYEKKFGSGDMNDLYMAFKMGLTLTEPERGTWDSWIYDLPFNWVLWTYPQGNGNKGRFPMHVDCNWMTTGVTADNVDAAFQVLRYTSYSVSGNLARQSMWDEENEGKYELTLPFTIPATLHPDVAEKFKSNPNVTEAIAYMYDSIPTSVRADVSKLVPGWDAVHTEYISAKRNEVTDGKAQADTVAAEIEDKANAALAEYWAQFDADLKKFKDGFVPVHTKKG